jgi:site-specific DNA-methyltransferase (adenine-specific)
VSGPVAVTEGDCLSVLPTLGEASVDAVVTDPPYEIGFMGKAWDGAGVAFDPATWRAVLRVLKPGGYMVVFGGCRTYHRLTCAVEDAGFEVRDCLMWLYGNGFPKGRGCLKPAYEPAVLTRKPGRRVSPLSIDECRVPAPAGVASGGKPGGHRNPCHMAEGGDPREARSAEHPAGRWPANVAHDGSAEVMEAFAAFGERASGVKMPGAGQRRDGGPDWRFAEGATSFGDSGSIARFFYCGKARGKERGEGNTHPTVKPVELMRWLVRLVTPKGGTVLDPFAGSGTTGVAAVLECCGGVLVESDPAHCETARRRCAEAATLGPLFDSVAK